MNFPKRVAWDSLAEGTTSDGVIKFTNVRVFSNGRLAWDDVWVRRGRVIDPASRFWEAASVSEFACDLIVDCGGHILAPGFIDVQINGAYGVDFSDPQLTPKDIEHVCHRLLSTGVTALCPTIVSSSPATYAICTAVFAAHARRAAAASTVPPRNERTGAARPQLAEATATVSTPTTNTLAKQDAAVDAAQPKIASPSSSATATMSSQRADEPDVAPHPPPMDAAAEIPVIGARIIGMHMEGPFINLERKGAHAPAHLRAPVAGMATLTEVYGPSLDWADGSVRIVTLAPELPGALEVVHALSQKGVVASIGHTSADIRTADAGVDAGARLITHLFNAMSAFHHRDPGVIGLLGRKHGGVRGKAAARAARARLTPAPGGGALDGTVHANTGTSAPNHMALIVDPDASASISWGDHPSSSESRTRVAQHALPLGSAHAPLLTSPAPAFIPHPLPHYEEEGGSATPVPSIAAVQATLPPVARTARRGSGDAVVTATAGATSASVAAALDGFALDDVSAGPDSHGSVAPNAPIAHAAAVATAARPTVAPLPAPPPSLPSIAVSRFSLRSLAVATNAQGQSLTPRGGISADGTPPASARQPHAGPVSTAAPSLAAASAVTPWSVVPFRTPREWHRQQPAPARSTAIATRAPSVLGASAGGSGGVTPSGVSHGGPVLAPGTGFPPRRIYTVSSRVTGRLRAPTPLAHEQSSTSLSTAPPQNRDLLGDLDRAAAPVAPPAVQHAGEASTSERGGDSSSHRGVKSPAGASADLSAVQHSSSGEAVEGPSAVLTRALSPVMHALSPPRAGAVDGASPTPLPGSPYLTGSSTTAVAAAGAHFARNGVVIPGADEHGRPFYSLIVDGVHVHPYAVTVAYDTHPRGLILVTDAMKAMGLPVGRHTLGELSVDIFHGLSDGHYEGLHAVLTGTATLAGAVVPLDQCLRNLVDYTQCEVYEAIAAVTTHPARLLRLDDVLGTLAPGAWADAVLLDGRSLGVLQTWVSGRLAYVQPGLAA